MPGDDKDSISRLKEVQGNNDFRNSAENGLRNTSNLAGAYRSSASPSIETDVSSVSPASLMKSLTADKSRRSIGNQSGANKLSGKSELKPKTSSKLPQSRSGLHRGNGLSPKQQLAKKGIQMAAQAINPALGAAAKSQLGQRLTNALLQKQNLITSPFSLATVIPNPLKPEDKDKVDEQGKKKENRFGSVSFVITRKVKMVLIPVGISCALVVFGCCVIVAAAHSFVSLLGVDLSSQISIDESKVSDAYKEEDDILEKLSDNPDGADTNSIDISGVSTSNSSASKGEASKYTTQDDRIKWLYDGKGVPQTDKENKKYLETFEVEILDGDGKPATMNITMHTKLKKDVQEIFKEMKAAGFKIHGGDISYRAWGSDGGYAQPFYYSAHTYGHAFDVNPIENCYKPSIGSGCTIGNLYSPGVNEYSVTSKIVNIWKSHGFYWGGDWSAPIDYMHFSYFDH